jgi:hypothetical protein
MLAYLLTVLDVDFTVESPAGYTPYLAAVAARFQTAAATSATTPTTDRRTSPPA